MLQTGKMYEEDIGVVSIIFSAKKAKGLEKIRGRKYIRLFQMKRDPYVDQ